MPRDAASASAPAGYDAVDKIFQRRLGLLPSARASSIIANGAIMYSTGEDMPGRTCLARQLADVAETARQIADLTAR
jgi:hypothetical protein